MSNLLATPRFWDKKAVALKLETGYGVDATPTGAANWMEARNISLKSFDAETAERNIELPHFGRGGSLIVARWASLSFSIALASSGTLGTAPKWAPALLGCGTAETVSAGVSVTYNLVSAALPSVSAYLEIDGVLYKFVGARGNCKLGITAKGIPELMFEFQSVFAVPATGTISGIVKTGWQVEEGVNATNTGKITLNAIDLAFSKLDVDFGNSLARINLPGPQVEVAITDRQPTASVTVLAPALAVFDPYSLANSGATVALTNTHGSAATKRVKTDLNVRVTGVQEEDIDGMLAYALTLEPTPVSGNDEITLTCL